MNFSIAVKMDKSSTHRDKIVLLIQEQLNDYFKDKSYGADIRKYSIMLICIKPKEGFEDFYKVYKATYVDHKIKKNSFTGEMIEMNKLFMTGFKFEVDEYDEFINATDEVAKKMLAQKIIGSLANLDSLPKKVKDFDKERFRKDMRVFFERENLIG